MNKLTMDVINISDTGLIVGKKKSITEIFDLPIEIINFVELTTKVSKGKPTIKFSYKLLIDGKVYSTYTGSKTIRQQLLDFKSKYANTRLQCRVCRDSSNMFFLSV